MAELAWLFGRQVGGVCEREVSEPLAWQPKLASRVEVMVSGELATGDRDTQAVRRAINELQGELVRRNGMGNVEMRVTAFLDGCVHRSRWHKSAVDVGNSTLMWHCHPGGSEFGAALARSLTEGVDTVIIVGSFGEEPLRHAVRAARMLAGQGARVSALHIGTDVASVDALEQIAIAGNGLYCPLPSPQVLSEVIPDVVALATPRYSPLPDRTGRPRLRS